LNIVSTWLYISPDNENIKYYQVKGKSSSKKFIETYLKNIVCFFWSAKTYNVSNTKYILFINNDLPNYINDFDLFDYLNAFNVEVVKLDNIFCVAPPNYYKAWNSQFVIIDILKWFSLQQYYYNAILLDNDCLIIKDLNQIFDEVSNINGILNYEIDYDENFHINGLNQLNLKELYNIYHNTSNNDKIKYFGGEFICFNNKVIKSLYNESIRLYLLSLERFYKGEMHYYEEAHLLSSVYHKLGFVSGNANKYIKRIWTNPIIFSNVNGSEHELFIWHLPSEKGIGFDILFKKIKNNSNFKISISDLSFLFRLKLNNQQKIKYSFFKKIRNLLMLLKK
jgi:hypothetical protein